MIPALLFLRAHWRPLAITVVLLAIAAVIFFVARRTASPPPAAQTVTSSEKLYSDATSVETKAVDTQKVRTVTTLRDRITTHPDGTVMQEHTERHSGTQEQAHSDERKQEVRVETREVERRVEVPAPVPKWRVGALVGIDITRPPLLSEGRVGFGVLVERRLVGPVSVGAWGTHTGAAGVVLTVEF